MTESAFEIIRQNGAIFLLAGLGPTLLGYGIEGALKFGSYESLKPIFQQLSQSQAFNFMLASIVSGVIASIAIVSLIIYYFLCSLAHIDIFVVID
jgi:solute carrier family 25 phosphate transporter 3